MEITNQFEDTHLSGAFEYLRERDPDGSQTAGVIRATLDQLYDGQATGRYRWDQLHKTEKTHYGTLIEINMQRHFRFDDGEYLDFSIAGDDVDCKFSQRKGGWMIPTEARNRLCLVMWADDTKSRWSMGLVRANESWLRHGANKDKKTSFLAEHLKKVRWLFDEAPLPENLLLHLPESTRERILAADSGSQRINELLRSVQHRIISRTTILTVAQQKDPMKRIRGNGGARSALSPEGILILGHYSNHAKIAEGLGLPIPGNGEVVSARVVQTTPGHGVNIDRRWWRLARAADPNEPAPTLPSV